MSAGRELTARIELLRAVAPTLAFCVLTACASVKPPIFGVRQGQLMPCPELRACVSSQAKKQTSYIAPLRYQSGRKRARRDLVTAIQSLADAQIVSSHRDYIRARFPSSKTHGDRYYYLPKAAIDDLELYLVPNQQVIQLRSAARRGLYDNGDNRRRGETLRKRFENLQRRNR